MILATWTTFSLSFKTVTTLRASTAYTIIQSLKWNDKKCTFSYILIRLSEKLGTLVPAGVKKLVWSPAPSPTFTGSHTMKATTVQVSG